MVGEPSMTRMATNSLLRKPKRMANGKKMAGMMTSLIRVATRLGLIFARAFRPSKVAPTTSRAIGLAVAAILLMAFSGM